MSYFCHDCGTADQIVREVQLNEITTICFYINHDRYPITIRVDPDANSRSCTDIPWFNPDGMTDEQIVNKMKNLLAFL